MIHWFIRIHLSFRLFQLKDSKVLCGLLGMNVKFYLTVLKIIYGNCYCLCSHGWNSVSVLELNIPECILSYIFLCCAFIQFVRTRRGAAMEPTMFGCGCYADDSSLTFDIDLCTETSKPSDPTELSWLHLQRADRFNKPRPLISPSHRPPSTTAGPNPVLQSGVFVTLIPTCSRACFPATFLKAIGYI